MGCSSSSKELLKSLNDKDAEEKEISNPQELAEMKKLQKKFSVYQSVSFTTNLLMNSNLLLYTSYLNTTSDFNSIMENSKEKLEKVTFKSSNHTIAIGYRKGYKLEFVNQDKFCVFLNGNLDAYIIIDGHGYFGNKLAQICQDILFEFVLNINQEEFVKSFQKDYENKFEEINRKINNREEKTYGNYDPYLSGVAVTIIVRIKNYLYTANVGNVLAVLFSNDKLMPSKFNITELTFNDSNFSEDVENNIDKPETEKNTQNDMLIESLIEPEEINMEIRRIYEHGGEIRKLLGESKSRIFVKGKYFPGLINTRSLGDHIGKGIGILSKPHVTKHKLNKSQKYFLLMCSDGISNVCNISKLVNLVQRNEQLLLESVTSIIAESRGMYRTHSYTPDMTLLIKEFKFEEF
jgi:serine/threonine protein phosphatase PrpC